MRLTLLACLAFLGATPLAAQTLSGETFDCVMDPVDVIALGAPVTGILEDVLVRRGERVTKGQPIARLESSVEEATVKLLRTRADSDEAILAQTARRDLIAVQRERIATLVDRNVASAEQLQEAEAELVAANALLAQAELEREIANQELARALQQLDQRTIKSPIDGIILSRDLSGGEYVAANGSIVSIVQLDPLLIEAFLPVELYPAISNGQRAMIAPAAPFTDNYEAQVITFDQVFDAASGTFGVELELPNPGSLLPAGHRCILSFPGDG
ncbi:efflux RND transporter periplasmic adaptor subunit [Yoonia sediminilitoris]|uniref:RND family efflux transporter MFP subunit n=1 Tax=Yoonia sediminilitoris TaxID=1286148 RepID=A0A2T6KLJ1_9RHOB|nr:efflux RND transporter periplasmic adaptor subunit [Yoonia sediminilitoris]PUB17061.1 RND family efflux transporter MFP subunit [Yoonia sediminilitoris]RCW97356.1 RND family efflux transporter MFP subunit [Yoonia sediminilitoris]